MASFGAQVASWEIFCYIVRQTNGAQVIVERGRILISTTRRSTMSMESNLRGRLLVDQRQIAAISVLISIGREPSWEA